MRGRKFVTYLLQVPQIQCNKSSDGAEKSGQIGQEETNHRTIIVQWKDLIFEIHQTAKKRRQLLALRSAGTHKCAGVRNSTSVIEVATQLVELVEVPLMNVEEGS